MKRNAFFLLPLLALATPAYATQGIACSATDDSGVVISLGSGTIPAPTWWANERVGEDWLRLDVGMRWIDDEVIRVMFVADDGVSRAGLLTAKSTGDWSYEGKLERDGIVIPMRCEPN
ncbi:hypothetical protein [Sphingomicrobium sediminis]|uniref:C-type lysozyme inhibitor domain-containing protein n=1 Tax=Sphingomicrobium sediminis TaxID=2950949 RepID=A0A9X2J130_9SPHN|nr:hypothetical protein [Sphingomicrobium sediminis]MCM8556299.1 hypothetical protein [Sphingomicrobium sediminis]